MEKASKKERDEERDSSPDEIESLSASTKSASFVTSSVAMHLVLIALVGLIAYSNTFDVPFQWDDKNIIVKNPITKNLSYFVNPSEAKDFKYYRSLRSRYVGFLTFALNYGAGGLNEAGYHFVNFVIHVFNAVLVYVLVLLTFKTPFLTRGPNKNNSDCQSAGPLSVALFSALVFVSHPVQTQAVTYIVQRFASLAAMFYLLSLALYINARLSSNALRFMFFAASLLSAVLAMKTKETAFTLPLIILLYEFMFFSDRTGKRILCLAPFILTMLIIPMTFMSLADSDSPLSEVIDEATRIEQMTRVEYLLTEFRVIVTYLRLLVLPVGQNVDYDYPTYHSLVDPQVLLSFVFLISLFLIGLFLYARSRITNHSLRIIALGIFWFFLTLTVESSIIPLHVIYEHRVYLPLAGVLMSLGTGVFLLIEKLDGKAVRYTAVSLLAVTVLVFSASTYARNNVWRSEVSLWEDAVRKSPSKARVHNNLGSVYQHEKFTEKAIEHYRTAIRLDPGFEMAYVNLGTVYSEKGLNEQAIEQYRTAISLNPDYANAHYNLGMAYGSQGMTDKAIEQYRTAIGLDPEFAIVYVNLGTAYYSQGMTEKAIEQYRMAITLNPDYAMAHYNLGTVYGARGLTEQAIEQFHRALMLDPDYADAHYNLGLIYLNKGLIDRARTEFEEVLRLNPDDREAKKRLKDLSD